MVPRVGPLVVLQVELGADQLLGMLMVVHLSQESAVAMEHLLVMEGLEWQAEQLGVKEKLVWGLQGL